MKLSSASALLAACGLLISGPAQAQFLDTINAQSKTVTNTSARVAIPGPPIFIPLQACPTAGPGFASRGIQGSFAGHVCTTVLSPPGCSPTMPSTCTYQARLITDITTNTRIWFNGLPKGTYSITQSAIGHTTRSANKTITLNVGSNCAWA